jgi:hypothetical protein
MNLNEYLPIKSNSAVPLFLQAIIYMLRIGGRCAVVLPEGQELFSKNKSLSSVREYLMKTCDLKEVIYLPAGTFTHTSIKTCIFYFIKKRECEDALKIKIKTSKTTNKETDREYDFSKTHMTSKVNFYDFNPDNGVKHILLEVSIEELSKNGYSLNYAEYLKDNVEEQYEDSIVIKTLGEICEFKNGKGINKNNLISGEYPVIGGGQKPMGNHNEYNTNENVILCSSSGAYAGFISKYDKKVWASDCFSIKPSKNIIDNNYLYYLLKLSLQDTIYKLQTGTAQPHVYSKNLEKIKIPIPSLETQKEVIKKIEKLNEKNKELEKEIEINKNEVTQLMCNIVKVKIEQEKSNVSESEYVIISYKNKNYILDNMELFEINDNDTKGDLFAKYKNGKVKKYSKS